MNIANPLDENLNLSLHGLLNSASATDAVKISSDDSRIERAGGGPSIAVPAKANMRIPLQISMAPDAAPFDVQSGSDCADKRVSYHLDVFFATPFQIKMLALKDDQRYRLITTIQNMTESVQSGSVEWKINDKTTKAPQWFHDVPPGGRGFDPSIHRKGRGRGGD